MHGVLNALLVAPGACLSTHAIHMLVSRELLARLVKCHIIMAADTGKHRFSSRAVKAYVTTKLLPPPPLPPPPPPLPPPSPPSRWRRIVWQA
jgi:hypothetical protein